MSARRVVLTYREHEALPAGRGARERAVGDPRAESAASAHQRQPERDPATARQEPPPQRALLRPLDCLLDATTIVQPDLVCLHASRFAAVGSRAIEGQPTLTVETLSPATTVIDRRTKLQLYTRHGIPFYRIVDPESRAIEVCALTGQGHELAARTSGTDPVALPPLADLAFAPDALWA